MEKLYDRIDFVNEASPALNATNLNLVSKAIDDIDTRVVTLANAGIIGVGNTLFPLASSIIRESVEVTTSTIQIESSDIYSDSEVMIFTDNPDVVCTNIECYRDEPDYGVCEITLNPSSVTFPIDISFTIYVK